MSTGNGFVEAVQEAKNLQAWTWEVDDPAHELDDPHEEFKRVTLPNLTTCSIVTHNAWHVSQVDDWTRRHPQLQHVKLECHQEAGNLTRLAKNCPGLVSLHLVHANTQSYMPGIPIDPPHLAELFRDCKQLTSFCMTSSDRREHGAAELSWSRNPNTGLVTLRQVGSVVLVRQGGHDEAGTAAYLLEMCRVPGWGKKFASIDLEISSDEASGWEQVEALIDNQATPEGQERPEVQCVSKTLSARRVCACPRNPSRRTRSLSPTCTA